MKLNFWQILGVVLLIAGAAWWFYEKRNPSPDAKTVPAATTQAR